MKNHPSFIILPILTALLLILANCDKEEPVKEATLTTLSVTNITTNTAQSGGNITSDGGGEITSRGVVWCTTQNPTLDSNVGNTSNGSGSGSFACNLIELTANTTYYVRAYAINSVGAGYGEQLSFTTEAEVDTPGTVRDIDGNVYPTVIIGNQEWMAENLRVTRDANGDDITRYCYDDEENNCLLYGGLYTWNTMMNGAISSDTNPGNVQGICPTGWHVPSHDEWTQLEQYICNQLGNENCETQFPYDNTTWGWRGTNEGNALKSCRQVSSPLGGDCATSEHPRWSENWRWNSHDTHYVMDEFGFSALPGGAGSNGKFGNVGNTGNWWSSTENSASHAWLRFLSFGNSSVLRSNNNKVSGYSVRCVRDN